MFHAKSILWSEEPWGWQGAKVSSPLQKFTFLAEAGLGGWMEAIDIQRFDQLTLGTSLLPVAAETDLVSFHLLWLGSQQDSVHVVTSHPWGGIRVPSSWGRERGAVGEGIPSHSLSRVGNPLKIICLQICKQDGHFSQPRARRERRKLIASSEAGMLKGQSEATPRCGYFFLCVKKKKIASPDFESSYCFFFFFEGKKKKMKALRTISFWQWKALFPLVLNSFRKRFYQPFGTRALHGLFSVTEYLSRLTAERTWECVREEGREGGGSHQLVYSRKEVFIPRRP